MLRGDHSAMGGSNTGVALPGSSTGNEVGSQTSGVYRGRLGVDEDRIQEIKKLYGLSESQVKAFMKRSLKPSSYRLWRKRVYGRTTKHHRSKIKSSIWSKNQNN